MPSPLLPAGTKGELLLLMKHSGLVSLADAEAATGLTRPTLHHHLGGLERDGLAERTTQRQGRGRPSLRYGLTPLAEALFPSRDDDLLGRLLDFLQQQGDDDTIRAFFEQYWEERFRDVQRGLSRVPAGDDAARLRVLGEILREQGFMPEIQRGPGGLVIRECNCPFPEAVKRTRLPCQLEARFFERLFDDRIGRVSYIPDGAPACTYEFPEPASTP